tara:strand:- start:217 stop:1011 length:795 start_codon:yes stop_codon:yes gene_type:complete
MNSIKISHEVPLCLLEESLEWCDYQYCLPHLLDEYEEYKNHFIRYKERGGYIIMDNSLHELGHAYDFDRLMYWVEELEPDEFIIPDVWEDMEASIANAKEWRNINLPENVEKVVVVQAKTINEAFECTTTYQDLGYNKICYSYGASYYNDVCPHPNKDLGKALGRVYVISTLYNQGALTKYDRVHLLGCSVPQEFNWYKDIKCIESIDTSNPVMAALESTVYSPSGLYKKPKANMNDHFRIPYNDINMILLSNNLKQFKNINNL